MPCNAVEYELDCPNKTITVTWKVLIKGTESTEQNIAALLALFEEHFNRGGDHFNIGDCDVVFRLDVEKEVGQILDPDDSSGDRDLIVIEDPRAGGGGFHVSGPSGRCQMTVVNPTPGGDWAEWKAINELGHGLGIDDQGHGLAGEWNLEDGDPQNHRVQPKHIEEALNEAPRQVKEAINECCNAHLTVGKIVIEEAFPERRLEESNPRDDLYRYFPPGSENPFTEEYQEKLE